MRLDLRLLPTLVIFYSTTVESRFKLLRFTLATLVFFLLVSNISFFAIFRTPLEVLFYQSLFPTFLIISNGIFTKVDETGGLGRTWSDGLKEIQ
ncbi:MAG: hypothetical protein GF411_19105 [Candidatus Lokiarchaeota archaeon]|nr:hypothetical protein [Candidatus Lokiarchaeota archaeon]